MSDQPEQPPRFEDALARLEQLVGLLEDGELDLEGSLANFEEGVKLVRLCSERLKAAELRVAALEQDSRGARERPLDLEAGE